MLETEYRGVKYPNMYICKCGYKSKISLDNLLRGVRCMECYLNLNRGENHPNYNPNLTEAERIKNRKFNDYELWRMEVYKRDNYVCQCCGDNKGGNLVAHHLDGYDWCKEKRTDIDNGITLCETCHMDFHKEYKYGGNTKEQFYQWIDKNSYIDDI